MNKGSMAMDERGFHLLMTRPRQDEKLFIAIRLRTVLGAGIEAIHMTSNIQ
jgi:hypothetical protein